MFGSPLCRVALLAGCASALACGTDDGATAAGTPALDAAPDTPYWRPDAAWQTSDTGDPTDKEAVSAGEDSVDATRETGTSGGASSGGFSVGDTRAGRGDDIGAADGGAIDGGTQTLDGASGGSSGSSSGSSSGGSSSGSSGASSSGGSSGGSSGAKEFNQGFIGGTCKTGADCPYANSKCISPSSSVPGGMCTQACTKYCPDKTGFAVTFCIAAQPFGGTSGGLCTARCDFGKSPTGCRPGYQCKPLPRYGEPGKVVYACVPGTGGGKLGWCHQKLVERGAAFTLAPNPKGTPKGWSKAVCNVPDAVFLSPAYKGVTLRASSATGKAKPVLVSCTMALAIADMIDHLQGTKVTDIIHYGTYNCRVIAGTKTLSQHGLANALDIAGFTFSTGAVYTVLKDWEKGIKKPKTPGGKFLKWFVQTMHADKVFNVILTPEFNSAHANHFHVDMTPGSDYLKSFAAAGYGCCPEDAFGP